MDLTMAQQEGQLDNNECERILTVFGSPFVGTDVTGDYTKLAMNER